MIDYLEEIFNDLSQFLMLTFKGWGWSHDAANFAKNFINLLFIGCISALSWWIAKIIIIKSFHYIAAKTDNKYDDKFVDHKVLEPLSQIFPTLYIRFLIQFAISDPHWVALIKQICDAWNALSVLIILFRALDAVYDILNDIMAQRQRKTNVRGYIQGIKIIIGIIGGIICLACLFGKDISTLLGGLAGMSAILMLVFKDTISGFVASVQLTSLNMVKMNDWITMPSRNIQGNVVEITLNTIKVRNFDNSVVTVPTASLMSESFINWSNMQEMEARRMERTIMIDADTIETATPELMQKVKKIDMPMLQEFIAEREKEAQNPSDNLTKFENREITNLELFRKYIEFYIKSNYQIFKKYKPTTISDDKGNTREIYIIEDKADFMKIHGADADKHLMEYKGHTIIKDFENFLKAYKGKLMQDKKDKKTYYPTVTVKNTTYINDKAKSLQVQKRIVVKEGTFVENGHMMVRQMQQTATGVPLEIYCFTKVTEWGAFEKIQSAFFEHLFAIIKEFNLRAFQFSKGEIRENAIQ
ncbi:MAG: mechanosensitive ion channel family protein [Bacteroidales bacterium]|nr:mechanosensitive ion channel family protein [Bacteroidales bacterium]